jgi:hypothetical protein
MLVLHQLFEACSQSYAFKVSTVHGSDDDDEA